MRYLVLALMLSCCFCSCNTGDDHREPTETKKPATAYNDVPTEDDIKNTITRSYERSTREGDNLSITFHDIKIGQSGIADLRKEYQGIPKGTTVTDVLVNFTVVNPDRATRESRFWMYKNEFGDWKFFVTETKTEPTKIQ